MTDREVRIGVDRCGIWHRRVTGDGSARFALHRDPYELDPPTPGNVN